MASPAQQRIWIFGSILAVTRTAVAVALAFMLAVILTESVQAQTFLVLHTFTGPDGQFPAAGLNLDRAGNLYGTTAGSGYSGNPCSGPGCGSVFKLALKHSSWIFSPLYNFVGGSDGATPEARVIVGPNGTLYGTTREHTTTNFGGVFNLRPSPTRPVSVFAPWTETVIHRFIGTSDGADPLFGDVVFDQAGNLYGTTGTGGSSERGVVYKLTPSGGGWTESILYNFTGGDDGGGPYQGVIFDKSGNLYGTTSIGGANNWGTVYELMPSPSGWIEKTLYTFQGGSDGGDPRSGLIFDNAGNLYGSTSTGGSGEGGTVFMLSPSNGSWAFNLLYSFTGVEGPQGSLVMDAVGSLYGTTFADGAYGSGSVFKLTPGSGGWTYTSLHDFCAQGPPCSDGALPNAGVILDANGNLYGTTFNGGEYIDCCGVVFEIKP